MSANLYICHRFSKRKLETYRPVYLNINDSVMKRLAPACFSQIIIAPKKGRFFPLKYRAKNRAT